VDIAAIKMHAPEYATDADTLSVSHPTAAPLSWFASDDRPVAWPVSALIAIGVPGSADALPAIGPRPRPADAPHRDLRRSSSDWLRQGAAVNAAEFASDEVSPRALRKSWKS
jgi:hypothetical protein